MTQMCLTRRKLVVAAVGCLLLPMSAHAALIVEPAPVTLPQDISPERVRSAIRQAAQARHWGVLRDEPGRIDLAYPTGARASKHQLQVSVNYDARTCSVRYLDSYGLDAHMYQDEFRGHRKITKWMRNLRYDIERFVRFSH